MIKDIKKYWKDYLMVTVMIAVVIFSGYLEATWV